METEQTGFVGWIKSRSGLAFIGFAAIAVFFLWEEHKALAWRLALLFSEAHYLSPSSGRVGIIAQLVLRQLG